MTPHSQSVSPEALFAHASDPPVRVKLRCSSCGRRFKRSFEWVCVSPERAHEDGWDGVTPSDIVGCPGCGAADEYTVTPLSLARLLLKAKRASDAAAAAEGRVILAHSQLWDGTVVQRPTQALGRLRELTREQPENPKAFRCLGNGYHRWGLQDEAVWAWKKACDLDEEEFEAAFSLAKHFLEPEHDPAEGWRYLRRAVASLPDAVRDGRAPEAVVDELIWILEGLVEVMPEPLGLMAVWVDDAVADETDVTMSSVNLKKVKGLHRLFELVMAGRFAALDFTPEIPDEEPTLLQELLSGDPDRAPGEGTGRIRLVRGPRAPLESPVTVGRNDPCPCGSGKKHKRCCWSGGSP